VQFSFKLVHGIPLLLNKDGQIVRTTLPKGRPSTKSACSSLPSQSGTLSKQAGAIRDISPGYFKTIQCFSQQLDLSILCDQAAKEELMNGSSRFAGHRGELVFPKGLVGSIDQHLDILEFEAWKEIAHELEKTGDRVASLLL